MLLLSYYLYWYCFVTLANMADVKQTFPNALLGNYAYSVYDGSTTSCGTGSVWDDCTNTTIMKLNYTQCSKQMFGSSTHIYVYCQLVKKILQRSWFYFYFMSYSNLNMNYRSNLYRFCVSQWMKFQTVDLYVFLYDKSQELCTWNTDCLFSVLVFGLSTVFTLSISFCFVFISQCPMVNLRLCHHFACFIVLYIAH